MMARAIHATSAVRIGVLFSPTSIFRDHETAFMQGTIAGIAAVNRTGGIGGRPLEPIFYDPKSEPSAYPGLIARLVLDDEVSHIFGGVISPARKAALPVMERLGAMLWYPNQYEGFELSPNIVYGGPCPNQYNVLLAQFIRESGRRRVFLAGSDYSFPRECLRIFRELAESLSIEIVGETYLPFLAPDDDYFQMIAKARSTGADIIVSAVVYPGLLKLFRAFKASGSNAIDMPLANIAGSEMDFALAQPECVEGHIAVGPYFECMQSDENTTFIEDLRRVYGPRARPNMHTLASYNQIRLFARALEQAQDHDLDCVREVLPRISIESAQGSIRVDSTYQCVVCRPNIGVATDRGQYVVISPAGSAVDPDPYMVGYG